MISPIKEVVEYKCGDYLKSIIPPQSVVDTFGFYSGKLEFDLAQSDRIVRAHTNRYVVYEFWHCVQEDPARIVEMVEYLHQRRHPISSMFMQDRWASLRDHYVRAAMFFLLNVYSEDGRVSSGNLSFNNYNPILLNRLTQCVFENLRINFYKDEKAIEGINYLEGGEYILLPMGKYSYNLFEEGKSYGHETTPIDHQSTKLRFDELKEKTAILYRTHPEVFKLYDSYDIKMLDGYGRLTENYDVCEEVVIANF